MGRDSTGDHLFLMEDGVTWACLKEWHPPYFEKVEGADKDSKSTDYVVGNVDTTRRWSMGGTVSEIRSLPNDDDDGRKTTKEDASYFGIRYEYDLTDGEVSKVYYPYTKGGTLSGYKVRGRYGKDDRAVVKGKVEEGQLKKFYAVGDMKGIDLFGQAVLKGHDKLIISEGEEDIKAIYHMLHGKYPDMAIDYLSIPTGVSLLRDGTASLSDILPHKEVFDTAKEVYVCVDEDEAGRALKKALSQLLGGKARILSLPEKDASDMLTKDKERDFIKCFFNASGYKPDFMLPVSDLVDSATERIEYGLSYPWDSMSKALYGAREGEITGIGASAGCGKTAFISQLTNHLMFEHKAKVAVLSLEEEPSFTLRKYIGTIMGKQIHLPGCEYDIEEAREVSKIFEDTLYIYNHVGNYNKWEDIVAAVRYYVAQGVGYIVIDPLSALIAHLTASEGNEYLGRAMIEMSQLSQELGVSWYHINHLNSPQGDKDHSSGARVYSGQFSGSRAQHKFSHNLIALERDQQEKDEVKRNTMNVRILKNRLSGNTSSFSLVYNCTTGRLEEPVINLGGLV